MIYKLKCTPKSFINITEKTRVYFFVFYLDQTMPTSFTKLAYFVQRKLKVSLTNLL